MTRNELTAEIARLENAKPTFGAFARSRAERLDALRAHLASMPADAPVVVEDEALTRWHAQQRAAENRQRATERRGY